jgi:small subunit ribosomal protein S20
MPNKKSAEKRMRSNVAKAERNRAVKSRVRTLEKKYRTLVAEGNQAEATQVLSSTVSALDKAVKKGVLHRSTVNRKKSRLAKAAVVTAA